jgi:hypothetical protein
MTAKTIKLPSLPTGLSLTCKLRNPTTLAVLETVTLTEGTSDQLTVYTGTVTGAHAGQLLFEVLVSGVVFQTRVRTIQDVAATFVILTELEQLKSDGRGANLVTITVTDGTDPLENATVRVASGVLNESDLTDVDGEVQFALSNATYTVTIERAGYESAVASLVVAGTTVQEYELTAIVVTPPASPSVATGSMLVLDENNDPEEGISISLQLTEGPGTAGYSLDTKIRTQVSNGSGMVEFTKLRRGATYSVWRGPANDTFSASAFVTQPAATRRTFIVPNTGTFNIAEVIGLDAEE